MPLTPVRQTLPNGVVVIAQENHTTAAVSLVAAMCAGGYDDAPHREGTAALLARVLDRGTATRTADQIADDLDGRGASVTVSAGRHQIAVSATCLANDFAPVLAIVADTLAQPVFPERDVATRRAELITTIRQEEDDPASVAVNRLVRELYGPHPYAPHGAWHRGVGGGDHARRPRPVPPAALHARGPGRRRGRQPAGGSDDSGGVRGPWILGARRGVTGASRARRRRRHRTPSGGHPDAGQVAGRHRLRVRRHRAGADPDYYAAAR